MSSETLVKIKSDMKEAMKAKEKERLDTVRLILAQVKQHEVDNREDVSEDILIGILTKMAKQRRESIDQFQKAERDDLVAKEQSELNIIQTYLPQQLSDDEVNTIINDVMATFDAPSIKDMGKIMGEIKPKVAGRTDMGKLSAKIKEKLS